MKNEVFVVEFNKIAKVVNNIAKEKGWWNGDRNDGELIALMHSELSECLEFLRNNNSQSNHILSFTGVEEELADVIIRIMDFAAQRKYNVAEALIEKINFNKNREYKHGGKVF